MKALICLFQILAVWVAIAAAQELQSVDAQRFDTNPLITQESGVGRNINGPSVIKVPSWIDNPLGTYYMYFASHSGSRIKLAYADDVRGPWAVYEPGTLTLEQAKTKGFSGHIASPDVHIDEDEKRILMYYHGPHSSGFQKTGLAVSDDGLSFECITREVGPFYMRVFEYGGRFYAVGKDGNTGGMLLSSPDGIQKFTTIKKIIPMMRHAALCLRGSAMLVFYSRAGDAPERILVSTMHLEGDPSGWTVSEPLEVLRPEADYEGIEHEIARSSWGSATNVCQLRDPSIYEEDGKTYLYYSYEGEEGIAGAELTINMDGVTSALLSRPGTNTTHTRVGQVGANSCDLLGRRLPAGNLRRSGVYLDGTTRRMPFRF